jgi:hypothetical protein
VILSSTVALATSLSTLSFNQNRSVSICRAIAAISASVDDHVTLFQVYGHVINANQAPPGDCGKRASRFLTPLTPRDRQAGTPDAGRFTAFPWYHDDNGRETWTD